MLKELLTIINRDGFIVRTRLAGELDTSLGVVDEGINHLLRMGYLLEEKSGADCPTVCAGCPFAKTCGKEVFKVFKISDKGKSYLNN